MKKLISLVLAAVMITLSATIIFAEGNDSATTDNKFVQVSEEPSDWAHIEVMNGIDEDLVPSRLLKGYKDPVSRGDVAEMFILLLQKVEGKTIDEILEENGKKINKDAFSDTSDEFVLAANALGIINGVGDGKFNPDGTLKRAQIAAIINRVAKVVGIDTSGYTHKFTDIYGNYSWVDTELGWPVHADIIKGVSEKRFNPDGDLTTEQAIIVTYRALNALNAEKRK